MNTIRSSTILATAVLLSACATFDRQDLARSSSFSPSADGFTFQSQASTNMQEDSSGAERNRIAVLEGFLKRNDICPSGYTVINRQVINRPKTMLGVKTLKDIIYTGRCNPL